MFFSVITKNLNWKISTKSLVTLKRWDEVKDGKFECYRGSLKNPIFRGEFKKNQYIGKKGGGVFEEGAATPLHNMRS